MTSPAISGNIPDPASFSDSLERESLRKALAYMGLEAGQPIAGQKIDVVFVGSCTNSRMSDLRAAASVLKGRKVSPNVRTMIVPGSQEIKRQAEAEGLHEVFKAAGAEWREAGDVQRRRAAAEVEVPGDDLDGERDPAGRILAERDQVPLVVDPRDLRPALLDRDEAVAGRIVRSAIDERRLAEGQAADQRRDRRPRRRHDRLARRLVVLQQVDAGRLGPDDDEAVPVRVGDPSRLADVVMENLIGDEIGAIPARLGPGVRPHAYGKAESRPGRKMGHLNEVWHSSTKLLPATERSTKM